MTKGTLLPALLMLPVLLLAGCGLTSGGNQRGAIAPRPESVRIQSMPVTGKAPTTVTVGSSEVAVALYDAILALPNAPTQQTCPAIAGPRYEMTFLTGNQIVLTATADASGCQAVMLGSGDVRQPNEAFWRLLTADIADASQPVQPQSLTVVTFPTAAHQPATTETFAKPAQAQQIYDAIRALPLSGDVLCPTIAGPRYVLAFTTDSGLIHATLDRSGCGSASLDSGSLRQTDNVFWQTFDALLATSTPTQAVPMQLTVRTSSADGTSSGIASATSVLDAALIAKLYNAAYALPLLPSNQLCPSLAGKQYELIFSTAQGITLLDVAADSSGCGTVTFDKTDVRLADTAFWTLLQQSLAA